MKNKQSVTTNRKRPSATQTAVTYVLILACAGGITALGISMPTDSPLVTGRTPVAWEYDAINNRHWHEEHGHWHPGPPPAGSAGVNTSSLTPLAATGGDLTAGGATPLPWEYDAENDRHWHSEHGHWHDGPPPAGTNSPNYPPAGG